MGGRRRRRRRSERRERKKERNSLQLIVVHQMPRLTWSPACVYSSLLSLTFSFHSPPCFLFLFFFFALFWFGLFCFCCFFLKKYNLSLSFLLLLFSSFFLNIYINISKPVHEIGVVEREGRVNPVPRGLGASYKQVIAMLGRVGFFRLLPAAVRPTVKKDKEKGEEG